MRIFLRAVLILLYLCLSVFIKPSEALAYNTLLPSVPSLNYISQPKSEITLVNRFDECYLVTQNQSRTEISNTSNRNYNLGLIFGEDIISEDNILRHFVFGKNNISYNRIVHKISPKLKNAIYTRAP